MAETERENIREATLEGLDAAARKGKHGGRPPVITDDMLPTVLRRRVNGESVDQIRPDLIIPTGKRKGQNPGLAITTGRSPSTRRPWRTPKPSSTPPVKQSVIPPRTSPTSTGPSAPTLERRAGGPPPVTRPTLTKASRLQDHLNVGFAGILAGPPLRRRRSRGLLGHHRLLDHRRSARRRAHHHPTALTWLKAIAWTR